MRAIAVAIFVLAAVEVFKSIYLGRKIHMSTVTGQQALTDLDTLFANLTAAIQQAANEFTALLQAIQNNNGVNPGAIETLVTQGQGLVANLNAAVAAAQAATNPAVVAITIAPNAVTMQVGTTQQFTASVTGSPNTGVTWQAQSGTIDANGLYTAPATAGTDVVTATSVADTTKSVTTSITINLPFTVGVTVDPATVTVARGQAQAFTASVTGSSNTAVTWSALSGTIDPSGNYTAPATPGTDTVTAISVADPSKSAAASVTVS